jgi:hypothetical protein
MSDYKTRAIQELGELKEKVSKLHEFILSDKFCELPEVDQSDLKEQLIYMENYFDVLRRRLLRMQ